MVKQEYMHHAIELAQKGEGWCHPNPLVGAVIVKDGRIIGEGYHERYGGLHAERNAIKHLTESAEGATIYVTLEPCCHQGKQPPCTEAIVEAGLKKVVIGSRDPNPLVAGKGAAFLRTQGIDVEEDFLREECDALNPVFFHYIKTKTPYVKMKYAMTLDGKIATKTGKSKWITGEAARNRVQEMRHAIMGIMAGIGTILADDPLLNCRLEGGKSPVRIICDTGLRTPLESHIVKTAGQYRTIVVCGLKDIPEGAITKEKTEAWAQVPDSDDNVSISLHNRKEINYGDSACSTKIKELLKAGIEVLNLPDSSVKPKVNLKKLMEVLGNDGIDSILLEGGGTLNESALKTGIVNEIDVFVAPKIFGGDGKSPVEGYGVELPDEAYSFRLADLEKIGEDILLRYIK